MRSRGPAASGGGGAREITYALPPPPGSWGLLASSGDVGYPRLLHPHTGCEGSEGSGDGSDDDVLLGTRMWDQGVEEAAEEDEAPDFSSGGEEEVPGGGAERLGSKMGLRMAQWDSAGTAAEQRAIGSRVRESWEDLHRG